MNGIIVINKRKDVTSFDEVHKIRKKFNLKKVGHTGTLDPIATGVLPIAIGKGTKIVKYLIEKDKEYIATILFGTDTDTLDITGKILNTDNKKISLNEIEKILPKFIGSIEQIPPIYSAIKVNGKKLYEYARNNEQIDIPSRIIQIYNIEILEYNWPTVKIKVSCSKGTYIRALIRDIAKELGTLAVMSDLIRTKTDKFSLENSISIENLDSIDIHSSYFYNFEQIFENYKKLVINSKYNHLLTNGNKLDTYMFDKQVFYNNELYLIYDKSELVAIYRFIDNIFRMECMLK